MRKRIIFLVMVSCLIPGLIMPAFAVNTKGWTKALFGGAGPGSNCKWSYYPWASSGPLGTVVAKWTNYQGNWARVKTGDINNDDYLEIVTAIYQGGSQPILRIYDRNGDIIWSKSVCSNYKTGGGWVLPLVDVNDDDIPEIFVSYLDTADNLKCEVYDGSGTLLKTINRGASGNDSGWGLMAKAGDKLFFACWAAFSKSPRGLSVCSYSSGSETLYYCMGPPCHGLPSLVDVDNNGTNEIALTTETVHNGASCNGTTDGDLWQIVINENGTELCKQLLHGVNTDGSLSTIIADIDADGYHDEILWLEGHWSGYPGNNQIIISDTQGTTLDTWIGPANGKDWYVAIGYYDTPTYDIFASAQDEEKIYVLGAPAGSADVSLLAESVAGAGRVLGVNDIDGDGNDDVIVYQ